MDTLASDLRQSARALVRRPGFLAVAVVTLALGIGANTALFSVVHAVLLRPLPYQEPERLVSIAHIIPFLDAEMVGGADFIAWREASKTLAEIAGHSSARFTLTGGEQPERLQGARVSANFLSLLGIRPERGRDFRAEEERLNAGRVAIVSQRLWDRLYGARGDVQEPSLTLDRNGYTVIGVLPRDFRFPGRPDVEVLVPLALDETVERRRESMTLFSVIGRLAPGVTIPQVRAELEVIRKRSEEEAARAAQARAAEEPPAAPGPPPGFAPPPGLPLPGGAPPPGSGMQVRRMVVQGGPGGPGGAAGPRAGAGPGAVRGPGGAGSGSGRPPEFLQNLVLEIVPLRDKLVGDVRPALLMLLIAVGFVLLIACANVANLLLARATSRQREIAVRSAMGAGRSRIARLLLIESGVLGLLGGALGLVFAFFGVRVLMAAIPAKLAKDVFSQFTVGIDGPVLLFTLGLALATGLLFGLAPAVSASRADLQGLLKEGGTGGRSSLGRRLLVAAEVALAAILLVGAGLLLRSFLRLQAVDPGFQPEQVLTAAVDLDPARYATPAARTAFIQTLAERVRSLPGVTSAGYGDAVPLTPFHMLMRGISAEGVPPLPPEEAPEVAITVVTSGYMETMGLRLVRGRLLEERDTADGLPVVLVNERLAKRLWGDQDPVGRRLGPPMDGTTVVGVVADTRWDGLASDVRAQMYKPFAQQPFPFGFLTLRSTQDPATLAAAVRREVAALDASAAVHDVRTMEERLSESVAERRFNLTILGLFAVLALVLAGVGLYGVLAYAVTERTREIGVRMALGAVRMRVLGLVIRQGLVTAALGVLVGLAAAFFLSRILASALFGITTSDPLTYVAIPLVLLMVALLASWLPARRATRVEPNVALRVD